MARMRPGTHTSVTDIHFDGIRVGDTVRDASGRTYAVDGYGRAKPDEGGNAVPLRDLDRPEIISPAAPPKFSEVGGRVAPAGTAPPPTKKPRRKPKPAPEPEPVPEPAAPAEVPPAPSEPAPEHAPAGPPDLSRASDEMLAEELRRRGWELNAVKRL